MAGLLVTHFINSSIQEVYRPLVKRLGFEYPTGEHPSTTKLRTDVISIAAIRGDEECAVLQPYSLKVPLTSSQGSSRNSNLASTTWLKPETIQGSRPTWRPLLTGLRSSTEAGNSGSSSRASTRLERLPLHASLQCKQSHSS